MLEGEQNNCNKCNNCFEKPYESLILLMDLTCWSTIITQPPLETLNPCAHSVQDGTRLSRCSGLYILGGCWCTFLSSFQMPQYFLFPGQISHVPLISWYPSKHSSNFFLLHCISSTKNRTEYNNRPSTNVPLTTSKLYDMKNNTQQKVAHAVKIITHK